MVWDHASPLTPFSCTCKSGRQETFDWRVEGGFDSTTPVWFYYVRPSGSQLSEDQEYSANFIEISPALLQRDWANNALPDEYQGCGITRTLISKVAAHRNARIRSSRNGPGETRSEAATAVWRRMVNEGVAYHDPIEDRFFYPASSQGAA